MLECLFKKTAGEICENFKNTYFEEHLWTTATVLRCIIYLDEYFVFIFHYFGNILAIFRRRKFFIFSTSQLIFLSKEVVGRLKVVISITSLVWKTHKFPFLRRNEIYINKDLNRREYFEVVRACFYWETKGFLIEKVKNNF